VNPSRNRAVAALERWRRFQEARAAIAHRSARADLAQAEDALAGAEAIARDAQRSRASLMAAPTLDLGRCRAVADIEAHLWRHAAQCEAAVSQAREACAHAQLRHRDAHAMTDVAARRRHHLDAALDEHHEKTTSDRLAELRNCVTRTPR
jgi:hypothetical protein